MTAKCSDWRFVNRVVKSLYHDAKFLSVTFPIFEKTLYRPMTSHSPFHHSLQNHELPPRWGGKVHPRVRFPTPRQAWRKKTEYFSAVGALTVRFKQVCIKFDETDCIMFILTTSGRPEPEYTLCRVMSSKPIHDEQLRKDCKTHTTNN